MGRHKNVRPHEQNGHKILTGDGYITIPGHFVMYYIWTSKSVKEWAPM